MIKEIKINVKGFTIDAVLIRESNPRLIVAQERVAEIDENNNVIKDFDLLKLFPSTHDTGFKVGQTVLCDHKTTVRGKEITIGHCTIEEFSEEDPLQVKVRYSYSYISGGMFGNGASLSHVGTWSWVPITSLTEIKKG